MEMEVAREQMSKANEDVSLLKSPITYRDIVGAEGKLGSDPVTPEDAALMQSAETRTYGKTQKDGAASVMQAAAEENVKAGFVQKSDHSQVAEEGVAAQKILLPGIITKHVRNPNLYSIYQMLITRYRMTLPNCRLISGWGSRESIFPN